MQIPFVDLPAQYASIKDEIAEAVQPLLDSARYIGGPPVDAFEAEFARYCEVDYAVGVANGTDALQLALKAVGVEPGDEVITAANTFIATAAAIDLIGARPVLVDIDPTSYNIDPALIEQAISSRTKAIVPVHLYGQPADMDPIVEIAGRHGIPVVEDAAQAHGATYRGRRAGSLGDVACFSFYPGKNLGAYGDAGAITTSDPEFVERIRLLMDHGRTSKYEHAIVGHNSRLDSIQAAILSVKLRHLDAWNAKRQQAAGWYDQALAATSLESPKVEDSSSHVYHLYVVRCESAAHRAEIQEQLDAVGIATGIHYPLPLHLQPALSHLDYAPGTMPETERAANVILSLPMFPELTEEQVAAVVEGVGATSTQLVPAD